MHGVPADLDLRAFVGARLDHLVLAAFIIYLVFDPAVEGAPAGKIGIEGGWELRDSRGDIIDRDQEPSERECLRLQVLIGRSVTQTNVHAPESFALVFDTGHELRIIDTPHYESFSIQPGDIYV